MGDKYENELWNEWYFEIVFGLHCMHFNRSGRTSYNQGNG